MSLTLDQLSSGHSATVVQVGGPRAFRRRLYELGLLPGTALILRRVAPLGDPIELELRGFRLSIRKAEARVIEVDAAVEAFAHGRTSPRPAGVGPAGEAVPAVAARGSGL